MHIEDPSAMLGKCSDDPRTFFDIILASASPRRSMLLKTYGFNFRIWSVPVDEVMPCGETIVEKVQHNAALKGRTALEHLPEGMGLKGRNTVLLAADTLVLLDQRVFGKPDSLNQAKEMLHDLAEKPHSVLTGLYLNWLQAGQEYQGVVETKVTLKYLDDSECDDLFLRSTPLDKAAGYGYQDAPEIVESIVGSQTNVVGLPMERLFEVLAAWLQGDVKESRQCD